MKAPSSRRHDAFRVLHSALTFAVAAATANAFGATVTLATADAAPAATTSFNSAGGWADGNAPSAGNDYVVALGDSAGLFLPTAAATFAGDSLTIGSETAAGFLSSDTFATWKLSSLNLRKGVWRIPTTGALTGFSSINVLSTSADPFVIKLGNNTKTSFGTFTGNSDSVLCIVRDDGVTDVSQLVPSFASFPGKVVLDGVTMPSLGQKIVQGLFGTATNFAPDRLTLKNGAGLGQSGYGQTNWRNPKLGITVDESGGQLLAQDHAQAEVQFPIVGGPLSIVSTQWKFLNRLAVSDLKLQVVKRENPGAIFFNSSTIAVDRVVLKGWYDSSNYGNSGSATLFVADATHEKPVSVDVSGTASYGKGRLFLPSGTSTNYNVTLHVGGILHPNPAADSQAGVAGADAESIAIHDLTYDGGVVCLEYDETHDALECLAVRGAVSGVSAETPLALQPFVWPAASFTGPYDLFKVRKTALTLTAEMIDTSGISFDNPAYQPDLQIAEDGDWWVAKLGKKRAQTISLVTGDGAVAATTAFNGCGERWSDGLAPHLAPYVVGLGTNDADALYFPSASETFAGTELAIGDLESGVTGRVDIVNAQSVAPTYTFARLALNKGRLLLRPAHSGSGSVKISGTTFLNSTAADPFVIEKIGAGVENTTFGDIVAGQDGVLVIKSLPEWNFRVQFTPASFQGRIILDGAYLLGGLPGFTARTTFAPDVITLKNGAAIETPGYKNRWNDAVTRRVGITIGEGGGGFRNNFRIAMPTFDLGSSIRGGDFFYQTGGPAYFYGSMDLALCDIYNATPFQMMSGASLDVDCFVVRGNASLTFNEGVAFAARATPTEFCVSNGTLKVGSALPSDARLVLGDGGVFAIANDGELCQSVAIGDAVLGGGATLQFDVDASSRTCDALVATGAGSRFACTREEKLNLVVAPADASVIPPAGKSLTFDLLTLPVAAGPVDKRCIDLSFTAESCLDDLKLFVLQQNGRQIVRLTNRNPGTCILLR